MAARSSIEFKKETLENVLESKEKAARSRVRLKKEVEQQVLGNEGMAARSSVEFKKETLENVSGSKEKEITLTTGTRKQTLQKMLGNETMAAPLTEEAKKKTVQDERKGKLSLENRDVLKTTLAGKSLTKKKAAQKKAGSCGRKESFRHFERGYFKSCNKSR